MDIRFGGIPSSTARIAVTSPTPDQHPGGSRAQSWGFDNQTAHDKPQEHKAFSWLAEGGAETSPSDGDGYLTAAYEQYDRRGRVGHPASTGSAAPVETFVLDRTEGSALDIRF